MLLRFMNTSLLPTVMILLLGAASVLPGQEKKPPKITYDDHVKPILQQKCFSCHNPDKKSGDLDLTNYTNLMQGGASGTVIEPGDSSGSYLYSLVTHDDQPYMPPESPKIPDEMIETLRKWIDGGVLENSGSKAMVSKKKKFDLALKTAPTERPEVVPMPARLLLTPETRTSMTTAITALATSPWGPLAAVAGEKQVLLYNTESLDILGVLPFPEGIPRVLKFSRNGSLLLAGGGQGGARGRVVVWNIRNGERIFEIGDELDEVLAADISSDQTLIALGGPQKVVRIYSTESGRLLHELRKHTDWIYSLEFSPDSVLLASGDRNGGLFVWEGWTGREYLTLKGHGGGITGVSWRSDSNILASCSEDSTIRLWEMENGGQVKNWGAHGGGASCLEFTRDGRILSCGRDRVAKLWDQNGAQQLAFEAFGDLALRVTYCDETNRAICGDWTGSIRVWNAADGAAVGNLSPNPPTLEERLTAAEEDLVAKANAHKPLAEAYQVAQATYEKLKTDLATAEKTAAEAQKQYDAALAKLNAAKEKATKTATEQATAQQAVDKVAPAVPTLEEAAQMATAAAAKLAEDKELAEAAVKLQSVADKRKQELETLKATVAAKTTESEAAKQDLAAAEKAVAETNTALQVAKQEVEKLVPLVKPAEETAVAAKQAADQTAAALTIAQNAVNRWNEEIAFAAQLTELKQKQASAAEGLLQLEEEQAELNNLAQQEQAAFDKANTDLAASKESLVAAEKQREVAVADATAAEKLKVAAMKQLDESKAQVATIDKVLLSLNSALKTTNQAVSDSGNEKALVDAAASLKALVTQKSTALEAKKKEVVEKTTAAQAATQKLTEAQQIATDAGKVVTSATEKMNAIAATVPPLQEKAQLAKQAAEAQAGTVSEAQAEVEAITTEIAVAQGLQVAAN